MALAIRLVGALLRPVWVDEAASALFSAGNSSWSTPRNALVPLDAFVQALRIDATSPLPQAMEHLQREDNHPPLHFALTAIGARLLQPDGSVLQPLTARLPAVLLGSLAVPLLHQAVFTATGSRRASRLAAAWMAVSPLAVAMGLEARHYALAITWVCAALWGLACCWQTLRRDEPLKLGPQLLWLLINLLGVATHHLFMVVIVAQALTLTVLQAWHGGRRQRLLRACLPLLVALGLGGLWLLQSGGGGAADQTAWMDLDRSQPLQWLAIPLQLLLSALCALLAPGTSLSAPWQWPMLVLAGLATLIGLISLVLIALNSRHVEPLLGVFGLSCALILLLLCLITAKDLSRALRYGFVFLPAVVGLLAAAADRALARHGQRPVVAGLLVCSLVCSLGVASGVALPASYNPELFVRQVQAESTAPIVLAFNERPVRQGRPLIGYEALSIAWHLQSQQSQLVRGGQAPRLILLVGDGRTPPSGLRQLQTLRGPFELWLVNAHGINSLPFERSDCRHLDYASAGGHLHHHYRCG